MPDGFLKLAADSIIGIPLLAWISVVVMIVVGVYMRSARSGRELYAIGSNPDAATLAGIRVTRRMVGAFVASGALAGLAGVLYASRYGTLDANVGTGQELAVVAAVVVGGVAIFGGSGSRLRRGARRAAAELHRLRPGDPEGQPVLGAGDRRLPAARRHRTRPAARPARRGRAAQEEWTPCRLN